MEPKQFPQWARALTGIGIIAVILFFVITFNRGSNDPEPTPQQQSRTDVPWEDYDASVKTRIDQLEDARDCAGLQAEFDTADANSSATLDRTGHGNALLMGYIDEALELSGCYTP